MNLVVEIGNTNIKFALFTGRKLNQLWLGKEDDIVKGISNSECHTVWVWPYACSLVAKY